MIEQTVSQIDQAATAIKSGKVILFSSDTTWALGCDVFNEDAYQRIVSIKGKEHAGKMILLVDSIDMLKDYVIEIHPRVETLLSLHTKPLSIIYPDIIDLPPYSLAPDGSAAIRVCRNGSVNKLIRSVGKPIVATIASTDNSEPLLLDDVSSPILRSIDYIWEEVNGTEKWDSASVLATYNKKGELEFVRK